MKARNIFFVLLGVTIGVAATLGIQHFRRIQAIHTLPSLADRNTHPAVDECSGVRLSRRDGRLHTEVHGGMGNPHKNFQSLLAEDRAFGIDDPIWAIYFEPGVTMEDLDSTLHTIHALGVRRYFLGFSFYGKLITQ
ncbi:MAG: hypothetical protein V4710_02495 [Verrucomicrobiota bacterium]